MLYTLYASMYGVRTIYPIGFKVLGLHHIPCMLQGMGLPLYTPYASRLQAVIIYPICYKVWGSHHLPHMLQGVGLALHTPYVSRYGDGSLLHFSLLLIHISFQSERKS